MLMLKMQAESKQLAAQLSKEIQPKKSIHITKEITDVHYPIGWSGTEIPYAVLHYATPLLYEDIEFWSLL